MSIDPLGVVLYLASVIGLARVVRRLPGRAALQLWLEFTWAHGKPLSCWTCLCFWCSLALLALFGVPSLEATALLTLAGSGVGGLLLDRYDPILPERLPNLEPPEIEDA